MAGRLFRADPGYDAEYGSQMIFWTGMIPSPSTRQRRGSINRRKAARLFDLVEHRMRP